MIVTSSRNRCVGSRTLTTMVLGTIAGVAICVFGIVAGLRLRAIRRDAVVMTKRYLFVSVLYTTFGGFLPFALMPTMSEEGRRAVTDVATKNAMQGLVGFAVWFLYLTYSKQVKALFGR
jgi:hypothetical protein